jgi:hypothetical protein
MIGQVYDTVWILFRFERFFRADGLYCHTAGAKDLFLDRSLFLPRLDGRGTGLSPPVLAATVNPVGRVAGGLAE